MGVVMKFGGTSVADPDAIARLIGIVRHQRERSDASTPPVVVVSALAGVTDQLVAVARMAEDGDADRAAAALHALLDRHLAVATAVTNQSRPALLAQVNHELNELAALVHALAVLREVSPRSQDAVLAVGELVSSRIVAAALADDGVPSAWVDARTVLITDAEHTGAAPDMIATCERAREHVAPANAGGKVVVLGGFIGATANGVTTTLGRGGSDYSAAIFGACLGVDEIQIWTDVDGMLTADPRIVRDVQVVPHLSFAEASELAYFGAKVLHPATIQPAVARNIPVRILNSRRPEDPVGTLITRERPPSASPLTAVASKTGVTVVDITSTRMLMAHGFLRRIFEVFEQHRISVDVVTTSEVSVSVTIDDARRVPEAMETLRGVADVTREDGMAILCAVGEGLQDDPAVVRDLLAATGGVPIRMVSQAAARRNITLVLKADDLAPTLERVHDRFFRRVETT